MATKYSLFLCLAGFLLLSGCAAGVNRLPSLEGQLSAEAVPGAGYILQPDWWTAYNDVQLNGLVQKALQNNKDLEKSELAVTRALYLARRAGEDQAPSLSSTLSGEGSRNTTDSSPSVRSYGGNVTVQYEVDLWRRLADAAEGRELEYRATQQDLASLRISLISEVVQTYFYLAYLDGAMHEAREQIAAYERIEQSVGSRHALGAADGLETAQAAQTVLAARASLIDLEAEYKGAEQTLRDLLGLRPSEPLGLRLPSLTDYPSSAPDLGVPLTALAERPDLRAAQFRLQSAFKDSQAVAKSLYPSISVGAALSTSSDRVATAFDVPFTSGSVRLNLPFLDWNALQWDVKVSQADYEKARLEFEQGITTALNEVDAWNLRYRKARQTLDTTAGKLEQDAKTVKYHRDRYRLGAGELSDWLSAQGSEAASRSSLMRAKYTLLEYESALYKAMGGRYRSRGGGGLNTAGRVTPSGIMTMSRPSRMPAQAILGQRARPYAVRGGAGHAAAKKPFGTGGMST